MARVKHKFVVLSGKGGVGKSTVAAYLATALAARGRQVGLLDTDIHGPSIPRMVGVEGKRVTAVEDAIVPIPAGPNLKVMSVAFLLRSSSDAVIWRGPLKMSMIEEFLANVDWGDLDYLIIDSPPGTGDEPLSVCQFLPDLDGAVVVATPQQIALNDVEKSITFCRQVKIPVAGVIENMSGYVCPHCHEQVDIFKTGGARKLAGEMGVPFLGKLPLVPEVVAACDEGRCAYAHAETAGLKDSLDEITANVMAIAEGREAGGGHDAAAAGEATGPTRKIALPVDGDSVSLHFGHSPEFALFEVRGDSVAGQGKMTSPPHTPGSIPAWLKENGVDVVIAGGMGNRAVDLLESSGIEVITGAPPGRPQELVEAYLAGTLKSGENVCDH
jgi:Mrp family chromosome partitioning ATPase/predicted Fe-Mo cluster-binding NifX family protein